MNTLIARVCVDAARKCVRNNRQNSKPHNGVGVAGCTTAPHARLQHYYNTTNYTLRLDSSSSGRECTTNIHYSRGVTA